MIETIEQNKIIQAQDYWRNNPVECSKSFFSSTLWAKQEEVMLSVRDYLRTVVKSANTVGKSKAAAEIAMWFLLSYYPSKVIITAPTFTQVEEILWKEIAKLYKSSAVPIGGDLLTTELKLNEEWFALGISTDEVNRMQGFHSPYLLIILDEALGIDPIIWEAVEGLHPYRILAIGNPLTPEGNFFSCFSSPLWHKITITAQECVDWQKKNGVIPGLVTQQWIDERRQEWGLKSPLYQSRVLAEFPQEGTDTLIHLDWVDKAAEIELDEDEDSLLIEACDVARSGKSKTVIVSRKGHTFYDLIVREHSPITLTAQLVKHNYENHQADTLVIDDDGLGGGVSDILTAQSIGILPFHGGWKEKATDSAHFKNLRSQFYWVMARKFEKGLYSLKKIKEQWPHYFEILKNQLCSIRVLPPDEMGRIRIETKEDMMARNLSSPDFADAMMMSEFGHYVGKMGDIKAYIYR